MRLNEQLRNKPIAQLMWVPGRIHEVVPLAVSLNYDMLDLVQ